MQTALSAGRPGRPPSKGNTPLSRVEAQNQELQKQVELLEQRLRCQEVLKSAETRAKKK